MSEVHTPVQVARLRELYSMMFGVPDQRVYMGAFRKGDRYAKPEEFVHKCGTGACMAGWAAVYPKFVAQGLGWDAEEMEVVVDKGETTQAHEWMALHQFFGVSIRADVFDGITEDDEVDYNSRNEKALALRRLRAYLVKHEIITPRRSDELEDQEIAAGIY